MSLKTCNTTYKKQTKNYKKKKKEITHPCVYFDSSSLQQTASNSYAGWNWVDKLTFKNHIYDVYNKSWNDTRLNFLQATWEQSPRAILGKKFSEKFHKTHRKSTCVGVSLLIKLQASKLQFSCKFCEILKKTFFYRTPPMVASG